MLRKPIILLSVCLALLFAAVGGWNIVQRWNSEATFSKATIKLGSSGQDVLELQGRLKYLGYYHGKIDGQFGSRTLQSVKNFQSAFGMKVDGIAGSKTKLRLWEATKAWRPGADDTGGSPQPAKSQPNTGAQNQTMTASSHLGLSETDLKYMANAVYGEARGEPYEGQVAVAAVILNRLKSSSFPNTIYGVIFEPRAFTAVADGQIWLEPDERAIKAVRDALNGWDPTGGCVYYFNPDTATSGWIWTRPQVKRIGKHIFCM